MLFIFDMRHSLSRITLFQLSHLFSTGTIERGIAKARQKICPFPRVPPAFSPLFI